MLNTSPSAENLGFLTVIDQPQLGLIGGYLVLNLAGRPLEFHCTTPLKPNRTQEILYGNTLEPFFYGEQIAQTLLNRSKVATSYILTNVAAVLTVQEHVRMPVCYVFETGKNSFTLTPKTDQLETNSPTQASFEKQPIDDIFPAPKTALEISEELNVSLKSFGIENTNLHTKQGSEEVEFRIPVVSGLDVGSWKEVRIGNRVVAVPTGNEIEYCRLADGIKQISRTIDLTEPFTRIRLAIEETQRAA
jgi:hypothetical protein